MNGRAVVVLLSLPFCLSAFAQQPPADLTQPPAVPTPSAAQAPVQPTNSQPTNLQPTNLQPAASQPPANSLPLSPSPQNQAPGAASSQSASSQTAMQVGAGATTSTVVAPAAPGSLPASMNPDVNFLEPYVFDVRPGRRNPFQPPATIDTSVANPMLPGSPLEQYDLDEIKLVGIMWNVKHPKAMFVDPQGKVYVLSRDDRIGRKHGYIAAIRDGEVVVVEASTFNGQNTYSTRILHIEKEN